jgi:hypothetical protein
MGDHFAGEQAASVEFSSGLVTRQELEVSERWSRAFPHLFAEAVFDFVSSANGNGLARMRVDASRTGFLTFVADRDG